MTQSTNNPLDALKADVKEILSQNELKKRRTIAKRFYVDEVEEQQIETLRQGVSFSAFVRSKVLGASYRPRPIAPQINREACIHLANLRNNCNQIAKVINMAAKQGKTLPLTQAYLDQLEQLEALLVEIGIQLTQGNDTTQEEE